jgi:hypothetical protein
LVIKKKERRRRMIHLLHIWKSVILFYCKNLLITKIKIKKFIIEIVLALIVIDLLQKLVLQQSSLKYSFESWAIFEAKAV